MKSSMTIQDIALVLDETTSKKGTVIDTCTVSIKFKQELKHSVSDVMSHNNVIFVS